MGKAITTTRAQESTNAIERMYITMRHLFNRGFYKPNGVSGEALKNALLQFLNTLTDESIINDVRFKSPF